MEVGLDFPYSPLVRVGDRVAVFGAALLAHAFHMLMEEWKPTHGKTRSSAK
jgi:hypothetical protein